MLCPVTGPKAVRVKGQGAANECEENMVIFHKNRQMRTQPEAKKKTAEKNRQSGKQKNYIFFCCPARFSSIFIYIYTHFFAALCSWSVIQRRYWGALRGAWLAMFMRRLLAFRHAKCVAPNPFYVAAKDTTRSAIWAVKCQQMRAAGGIVLLLLLAEIEG